MVAAAERGKTLGRIREICLGLPETSERPSHGAPTFFVRGKRAFLMVLTNAEVAPAKLVEAARAAG